MAKPLEQFGAEHQAFRARLRKIHQGPIGQAARVAMNDLREAYRVAALEHWAELGNRASTGWGAPPEGEYQTAQEPEQCAETVANTLAHYFSNDPNNPPGSRSEAA